MAVDALVGECPMRLCASSWVVAEVGDTRSGCCKHRTSRARAHCLLAPSMAVRSISAPRLTCYRKSPLPQAIF